MTLLLGTIHGDLFGDGPEWLALDSDFCRLDSIGTVCFLGRHFEALCIPLNHVVFFCFGFLIYFFSPIKHTMSEKGLKPRFLHRSIPKSLVTF